MDRLKALDLKRPIREADSLPQSRDVRLYVLVFAGVGATLIAAIVPSFPILHGWPWGYAIVWEFLASMLFIVAYGAVVFAMVRPVRVRPKRIEDFARGAATLLAVAPFEIGTGPF